jgi:hypothetical protein
MLDFPVLVGWFDCGACLRYLTHSFQVVRDFSITFLNDRETEMWQKTAKCYNFLLFILVICAHGGFNFDFKILINNMQKYDIPLKLNIVLNFVTLCNIL